MTDDLKKALDDLAAAVEFRDRVKAASAAGENTTSTGAFRDSREWLDSAATAVALAYTAPADHKMVLVVSGGCLQTVHVSKDFPTIDLVLIDHDNLEDYDVDNEAIEEREIADCPNVIVPDIPEEQCLENLPT
jgi:hypothetical protein